MLGARCSPISTTFATRPGYLRKNGLQQTVVRIAERLSLWAAKASRREFVKTRFGVLMKANWSGRTFRFCYLGTYDRTLERLLRRQEREFVFLDIGANQGLYSVIAMQNPRCITAIAFEPVASTHDLLTSNARINGAYDKIRAVKAGISSKRGRHNIFVDPKHSGIASLDRNRTSQSRVETIEFVTMADVDGMVPADGEILVKIDVEGHEEVVIRELVTSAHIAKVSAVFYEVDERRVDPVTLWTLLEGVGFRSFLVRGKGEHYDVLAQRWKVAALTAS